MRCPRCGNEIQPGEVFCGQCGVPSNPQGTLLEKDNARLTQSGYVPVVYGNSRVLQSRIPQTPLPPQKSSMQTSGLAFTKYPSQPDQFTPSVSGQNQRTGFYHGNTEVFVTPSDAFNMPQPPKLTKRSFPAGNYQYGSPSPVQGGSGIRTPYVPQSYPDINGQSHAYSRPLPPNPARRKQQHSAIVPIIGICLAIAVISVIGLLTVVFTKPHTDSTASTANMATLLPTSVATAPASAPLAAPDAGFSWCAATCSSNNFNLEYPATWLAGPSTITNGVQFINPVQTDILMTVKARGPNSGSATAGQLLTTDLQTNYAQLPGYTPPTTTQTAMLGGETWEVGIAYYQGVTNNRERLVVYLTVHQGNIYSIEMQAPDTQFDRINNSYYVQTLNKFTFLA